ncbi:MAG: ferrochelatase [Deltaproteobacteria bacterium]|nr:ferrochelatase [Deltaproteobacteria bacterium]
MPLTAPLTGVVLLNMGGPDSLDAVRPFLARLFSDQDLIRLPASFITQPLFAWIVSGVRARKVKRYYEEIGGGSPIGRLTELQRAALEAALRETGGNFRVYVGMRYWYPLSKHAVLGMKEDGVRLAVALPLYPQYFSATTGSSMKDLKKWMRWAGAAFPVREIRSYPDHPGYIAALSEKVRETVSGADPAGMHLLFSAHGVPQSFIDAGDPYQGEVERTVAAVMRAFPEIPHSISYQSRAGRAKWLGPDTASEVRRVGREGVRTLVVVAVSFVSDHIETLHELDIRLRATAEEAGIAKFLRVPVPNDSPTFIAALKDIVLGAAELGGDTLKGKA